ncbi:MAG: hypothetical protein HGA45_29620, partial [Chloroflexales bacterium]|nr:hypothetical protein [Chloroflexales bacterium]
MSAPSAPNPYVGPRSFVTGERLFGRARELRELLYLLIAERIVLLYSPSGAGKTSLIQADLVPALERKKFRVLPLVRLNREPPADAANRFVYSTLDSLEEGRPAAELLPPADLARMTLADYLARRAPDSEPGETVLIFDQFEELLIVDPHDIAARQAFFSQLGAVLENRRVWALFAMREEFIAQLDPYLRPIPNRLKDTFRLDLLGPAAARQAMQSPASIAGVAFTDEAAARLADDLRMTTVQRPDGTITQVLGEVIEPVQLQVVCRRLWEGLFGAERGDGPARPREVTVADVEGMGDVNRALADYYLEGLRSVGAATGVSERKLRDWFDCQLISADGIRAQVLQQPEQSGGLPNRVIQRLIDTHLVRAEERRGATWFELAHDRLVAPIRAQNAEWRASALTALQRQAVLWHEQGRPEGLLLRGEALSRAEAGLDEAELEKVERDFLAECRRARDAEARERRQNARIRVLAVVATLIGIVAVALAALAFALFGQAEAQHRLTDVQRLSFEAENEIGEDPTRALLLTYEVLRRDRSQISSDTLQKFLAQPARTALILGGHSGDLSGDLSHSHSGAIFGAAYSPDGTRVVTASADGTAIVWDAASGDRLTTLVGHGGWVRGAAYSPDGARIVTASEDKTAIVWDAASGARLVTLAGHGADVKSAAYSPDGARVVTASDDQTAIVWDAASGARLVTLAGHSAGVKGAAYSPDGTRIVTASEDKTAIVWDAASGKQLYALKGHGGSVFSAAYRPDGTYIVTASEDKTAIVWDAASGALITKLTGTCDNWVRDAAYSPDEARIVTTCEDGFAVVWDGQSGERLITLKGHVKELYSAAYSPDGARIVTASADGSAIVWDAEGGQPVITLAGKSAGVTSAAYSPDGTRIVTASADGGV